MQWLVINLVTLPINKQHPSGQELPPAAAGCSFFAMVRVPRCVVRQATLSDAVCLGVSSSPRPCLASTFKAPRAPRFENAWPTRCACSFPSSSLVPRQLGGRGPGRCSGSRLRRHRGPGAARTRMSSGRSESNWFFKERWEGFPGFAGRSKAR